MGSASLKGTAAVRHPMALDCTAVLRHSAVLKDTAALGCQYMTLGLCWPGLWGVALRSLWCL